jgi:hypothetical protein
MGGAIPLHPYMPSWHAQGNLECTLLYFKMLLWHLHEMTMEMQKQ